MLPDPESRAFGDAQAQGAAGMRAAGSVEKVRKRGKAAPNIQKHLKKTQKALKECKETACFFLGAVVEYTMLVKAF